MLHNLEHMEKTSFIIKISRFFNFKKLNTHNELELEKHKHDDCIKAEKIQ